MIASLGMYDRPETASANDHFWAEIRDRLRHAGLAAPSELERDTPFCEVWTNPEMIFSQTCGRPFRTKLHPVVSLIGTPDYGHDGCLPGYYRSAFIVRTRDPRTRLSEFTTARFAFNETLSQSGWAAPQTHVKSRGFQFENIWQSGGHERSAQAVAEGRADIAALDPLSWIMIKRYDDFSSDLRVLGWTEPTPGLPFITHKPAAVDALFQATAGAIEALSLADRRMLRIQSLVKIPVAAYLAVPDP